MIYNFNNLTQKTITNLGDRLKSGQIGVIPTDTIYGIVSSALNSNSVEKIFKLRIRQTDKPMIILISKLSDLNLFGIYPNSKNKKLLKKYWPGPLSVIFDCLNPKFEYLHRGKKSLAFRLPNDKFLLNILKKSGPLVAPSANLEGEKYAKNIDESKKYFGENIDFYIDSGDQKSIPSTLIKINSNNFQILRQGSLKVSAN